jgi:RNA polymerase sigma-70 factor (ECF subfamily)
MNAMQATGDLIILIGQAQQKSRADNASLVEAASAGDHDAFRRLYDLYAPMVHGILLARAPQPEVDDLVQDVFMTAFHRLHTLRDREAFGGWVAMIARNRAMDFHRRSRQTQEIAKEMTVEQNTDSDSRARRILEVISQLPEAYWETLVLRLVEGMTGPEIARRTGLTAASVRVNLHRGMKLLREKLHEEGLA